MGPSGALLLSRIDFTRILENKAQMLSHNLHLLLGPLSMNMINILIVYN